MSHNDPYKIVVYCLKDDANEMFMRWLKHGFRKYKKMEIIQIEDPIFQSYED